MKDLPQDKPSWHQRADGQHGGMERQDVKYQDEEEGISTHGLVLLDPDSGRKLGGGVCEA